MFNLILKKCFILFIFYVNQQSDTCMVSCMISLRNNQVLINN